MFMFMVMVMVVTIEEFWIWCRRQRPPTADVLTRRHRRRHTVLSGLFLPLLFLFSFFYGPVPENQSHVQRNSITKIAAKLEHENGIKVHRAASFWIFSSLYIGIVE